MTVVAAPSEDETLNLSEVLTPTEPPELTEGHSKYAPGPAQEVESRYVGYAVPLEALLIC